MLKKIITRKFLVATAALFALFLLYLIPKNPDIDFQTKIPQFLEYVDSEVDTSTIYLIDSHNYVAKTQVVTNNREIEKKARELMDILIKGGSGENRIPSGFQSIIPSDTKLISLKFADGIIKINFSKELLDIKEELEEKMIEAIVYTLTSIEEVKNVIIYVEGDILTKLPKSKVNLPHTLNRSFGINKDYNLESFKNINQVTIYYINKHNNNTYYVPVTKYLNDERDKIKIIIDELTSSHVYHSNLMSYLNTNAKLLEASQKDKNLELKFNNFIFSDNLEKNILEEVIYTICLSIKENYDVENIVFMVENEKVYENVLKTIE